MTTETNLINGAKKKHAPKAVVKTSEQQILYILSELDPELDTRKKVAEYVAVSPQTLYDWDKKEAFQALRHNILAKLLKDPSQLDRVWASCYRAATHRKKPNVYAIEKFAQRFDKEFKPPEGMAHHLTLNQTTINIGQAINTEHLEDISRQLQGIRGVEPVEAIETTAEPIPKKAD